MPVGPSAALGACVSKGLAGVATHTHTHEHNWSPPDRSGRAPPTTPLPIKWAEFKLRGAQHRALDDVAARHCLWAAGAKWHRALEAIFLVVRADRRRGPRELALRVGGNNDKCERREMRPGDRDNGRAPWSQLIVVAGGHARSRGRIQSNQRALATGETARAKNNSDHVCDLARRSGHTTTTTTTTTSMAPAAATARGINKPKPKHRQAPGFSRRPALCAAQRRRADHNGKLSNSSAALKGSGLRRTALILAPVNINRRHCARRS